jgi:hypothetical protein
LSSDTGSPAAASTAGGLRLVRAERRTFAGPARFLADPGERADLETYLSDLSRPYRSEQSGGSPVLVTAEQGHSYGEMAEALIGALVPDDEPVGLLVLAYSVHDVQPGRATATYLSHVCPGTPMAFAICDQGSAAAYTALRIARDYPAPVSGARSLVIVVEQAELPYDAGTALPARHRGVAMLFENGPAAAAARLVGVLQRPGLAPAAVAGQAAADLAELSRGYPAVRLVLSGALAAAWPDHPGDGVRVGPADQPLTGGWWQLLDELDAYNEKDDEKPAELDAQEEPAGLLVVADYDPDLGYLCLAALKPA